MDDVDFEYNKLDVGMFANQKGFPVRQCSKVDIVVGVMGVESGVVMDYNVAFKLFNEIKDIQLPDLPECEQKFVL